jgi:DNA-binding NarL/FixJ family response regulator
MIKLFIAEDQMLFAQGLQMALSLYPQIDIVGIELKGDRVIEAVINAKPDLLLLDINMPGADGITVAKNITSFKLPVKIIVLSSYVSKEFIEQMTQLGVHGYLHKNTDLEELVKAILAVNNNEKYFSQEVQSVLNVSKKQFKRENTYNLLGSKELILLSHLAKGLSLPKIADKMQISIFTAETHKKNIMLKLGLNNIAALIKYATERGLV